MNMIEKSKIGFSGAGNKTPKRKPTALEKFNNIISYKFSIFTDEFREQKQMFLTVSYIMEKLNIRQKRNLCIILSITLLSVAGVPTIIPAFPEISKELNVSQNKIGLLITVFTLPGAIL